MVQPLRRQDSGRPGLVRAVLLAMAVVVVVSTAAAAPAARNLIVLVADGCGSEQYTLARWWQGRSLHLDGIMVGAVRTHIADSVIADSAPAATAFATGCRSNDKCIGIGPGGRTLASVPPPSPEQSFQPLATIMEGARLLGKATGVVATSRLPHATPAGYLAHVPHREAYNDIMKQIVHQRLTVAFGGGRSFLLPKGHGDGVRTDGANLMAVLAADGCQVVETAAALAQLQSGPAFGAFAAKDMAPEIDRRETAPEQPSLAAMTRKAIELLAQGTEGFVLLVEGSQIDWACHANDTGYLLGELCQYDESVGVALDFARQDGQTLVLALSDHNTGGMTIGNYGTSDGSRYAQLSEDDLLAPLRRLSCSAGALWRLLGDERSPSRLKAVVGSRWGLAIDDGEASRILALAATLEGHPEYALGRILSQRHTCIGWTTHGHVGGDVPLFAFGPGSPASLVDAPQIGQLCARALGIDLAQVTTRLFVDTGEAFPAEAVALLTDAPNGPSLRITTDTGAAVIPLHTNRLTLDGVTTALEGLAVAIPSTGRLYLPRQAVALLRDRRGALVTPAR